MKTAKILTIYFTYFIFLLLFTIFNVLLLIKYNSVKIYFVVFTSFIAINLLIENYITKKLKELR